MECDVNAPNDLLVVREVTDGSCCQMKLSYALCNSDI